MNSVNAKSSAKRGLSFTASQLKQWHWNEHRSMTDIAKQFGVSVAAIGYWFQKLHVQHRSNLQEVLFEPTPALSYVVGCLLGDGCVRQNDSRCGQWEIRLQVTDMIFAEHFQQAVQLLGINCGFIQLKAPSNPKWNIVYLAYANSMTFGQWWKENGRIGVARIAATFPEHFVRGFYESEGTISIHKSRLRLSICNTDSSLIHTIHSVIPESIRSSLAKYGPYQMGNKARWDISIWNQLDIKRFLAWIMPCIKTDPRGHANAEPSRSRNASEGVENTKAIQDRITSRPPSSNGGCAAPGARPFAKTYSDPTGNRRSMAEMPMPNNRS
mgnify:FL=1